MMRVRDLIEVLAKMPPEMPVAFRTIDADYGLDLGPAMVERLGEEDVDHVVLSSDEAE